MRPIPTIALLLGVTTGCTQFYSTDNSPSSKKTIYQVILAHDGHPDPDDNGAALAGFVTATRNIEKDSTNRLQLLGMIYGDTTETRQDDMLNGGETKDSKLGKANYEFYKKYSLPAIKSIQNDNFVHYDVTPETYNFSPNALSDMTTGGQFIARTLEAALNNKQNKVRVVVSAGGGENTMAEAINYIRQKGFSDKQIMEQLIIVQHSEWNWRKATEAKAQTICAPFTLRIEDQNKYTGDSAKEKFPQAPVAPNANANFIKRTSETFVNAWNGAVYTDAARNPIITATTAGDKQKGIDNFVGKRDISDAGSHHFATNLEALDNYWYTRNNGLTVTVKFEQEKMNTPDGPVFYDKYKPAQMVEDLF